MNFEFNHLGLPARAHHVTLRDPPSGRIAYSELMAWVPGQQHVLRTQLEPSIGEIQCPDVVPFVCAAQRIEFDLGVEGILRVIRMDLPARLTREHLNNYLWNEMTNVHFLHRDALNTPADHELVYLRQLSTWQFEDCLERIKPEARDRLRQAYVDSLSSGTTGQDFSA